MGGSSNIGEGSDNPVEINVTAMVDVIFCLCIFFMCSFHFKQLEGKVDAWLPKDKGPNAATIDLHPILEEVRVFMRWDASAGATIRRVGNRPAVASDPELLATLRSMLADYERAQKPDAPVLIDATPDVPWQEVVRVLDLCKAGRIAKIEFAEPFESAARSESR